MLDDRYDEVSQAYLLLCGAAYLLEGYSSKVLPELHRLPNKSAYHIIDSVMGAVMNARYLLQIAMTAGASEDSNV